MKEELTSVIKQRDEVREEIAQFRRDNNIMEMQEIRAMQVRGMRHVWHSGTRREARTSWLIT